MRGKGWAEGQIIKYAIYNSMLLKSNNYFYKCTGKIICRNFKKISTLLYDNNIANMYWRSFELKFIADARFFYTSINDFERYLLPAYEETNEIGANNIFEQPLTRILDKNLQQGITIRPLLSGFSGGSGEQYEEKYFGELDVAFPCWYSNIDRN